MKIDGIDPTGGQQKKTGGVQKTKSDIFQDILDSLSGSKQPGAPASKTSAPLPGSGMPFIVPPVSSAASAPIPATDAVSSMDGLLTDLDMFKNALANNDVPLERLSSLVSTLVERKDELATMIGRVEDEDLKGMLSEALGLVIDLVDQYHAGYAA